MDYNLNKSDGPLFDEGKAQALVLQHDAAAVARATQEIQAALVIGKRFPRNEIEAKSKILEACKRKGLAEVAEYEYSRGGTRITGPTIDLLRAIANRWGNILFGWSEIERRNGESSVRCEAWDTQTNGHSYRSFVVKHWRDTQAGGYALNDERDIYEMLANVAARRVRACLEEVIDADVIDDAVAQCRRTLKEGEKTPLKDRAVIMVNAFTEFGVTPAMLETRLGNKLEAISENQLASLRRVFKALKDGVGTRDDYFKPEAPGPKFSGTEPPPEGKPAEDNSNPDLAPVTQTPPPQAAPVTPAPTPEPTPEPPQGPAPTAQEQSNLKLLRMALKAIKVPEGKFLEHMAEIGLSDGSVSTLEELQMVRPETVQGIIKNWDDIKARLQNIKASQ